MLTVLNSLEGPQSPCLTTGKDIYVAWPLSTPKGFQVVVMFHKYSAMKVSAVIALETLDLWGE